MGLNVERMSMMRTDGSLEPPGRSGMLTRVQRTPRQLPARAALEALERGRGAAKHERRAAQPGQGLGRGLAAW